MRFSRSLCFATCGLGVLLSVAPITQAKLVIDNFTGVGSGGSFPLVDEPLGNLAQTTERETVGTIGGVRVITLAAGVVLPPLSTPAPIGGSVTVGLDPLEGKLTSQADAITSTLLIMSWLNDSDTEVELNKDVSSYSGVQIQYDFSIDTDIGIDLYNAVSGQISAGNKLEMTIEAGSGLIYIPFEDFNLPTTRTRFENLTPIVEELPGIDLTSLDAISFSLGRTNSTSAPGGLNATIFEIAFVPEPGSVLLLGVGSAGMLMRRRR